MSESLGSRPVISVRALSVEYSAGYIGRFFGAKSVHAVRHVSFDVFPGQTFGIVGESGSGKSTSVRAIAGLEAISSGEVLYNGDSIRAFSSARRRRLASEIQMVFQDPSSALNPKARIGRLIAERVRIHRPDEFRQRALIIASALADVGLSEEHLGRFPHQLSGGQQQRVVIALGLISKPKVLICDEAVSGLDVSTQAQVLNLLNDLKAKRNLSIIFITHDISVARYISDEVAVMHNGLIVEQGTPDRIFSDPKADYTKSLMEAVPRLPRVYETARGGQRSGSV